LLLQNIFTRRAVLCSPYPISKQGYLRFGVTLGLKPLLDNGIFGNPKPDAGPNYGLLRVTDPKVGKSDGEGTFPGTRGNDEVAPIPAVLIRHRHLHLR
jgi:hypothetical protein